MKIFDVVVIYDICVRIFDIMSTFFQVFVLKNKSELFDDFVEMYQRIRYLLVVMKIKLIYVRYQ